MSMPPTKANVQGEVSTMAKDETRNVSKYPLGDRLACIELTKLETVN